MKTLLITIALMGFTAAGSYAQNKKCDDKKKVVRHKTIQKKAVQQVAAKPAPADQRLRADRYTEVVEPCYTYRKRNILVTQCPGTFYNNSDLERYPDFASFESQGSFTGNYPQQQVKILGAYKVDVNARLAPQKSDYSNKVTAPAGGNTWNSGYMPE